MKKTSNMFDAKRQNKYSIRKFTIGTASIIVGAALLFGLGEEARAAEVTSQTSNQSNDSLTDQPGTTPDQSATDVQTTDTETSQVETQTNTAAQTETQPIETSKETAPATAPETAEQPAPTEDVTQPKTEQTETTDVKEPAPEQQPASKHQSATQEAPAEQPTSVKEETAAKTEDTTVKTPTAQETAQTAPAKEEVVASEQNNATAPAENNTTEVAPQQEQQLKAADNTTVEGTQGTPSSVSQSDVPVNQEDLSAALQNSSNEKDNNTVLATQGSQTFARRSTFAAPSTFESLAAVNEQSLKEQLEKEAVYSPGVWNQKYGYQGYAVVMREGSKYNNTSSQKPIPNVPVYLQWTDSKGYVSPVYYTKSGQDGRYVFDLSKPQTDALGQEHTFNLAADAGIGIRTWAESPDNTLDVVKHGDGIRGFHKRLERVNESWDFTAGINRIVNSQVLLREKALANDWLTKPEEQWETSGTSDGIWKNTGIYGKVSGSIWHDLTDPYGSDARWIKKDPSDVNATGVKVIASYVNDEVAIKFDEWKKANPNATVEDFRNAQESIVTQYQAENGEGSHIAESVVGTVDKNGDYYIPFRGLYGISPYQQNSGTSISKTISDEEYGTLVKDADISHNNLMAWNGTVGQKHRHINSDYMYIAPLVNNIPTFGNNYHNNMFTSADVSRDLGDAKMLSSYNGSSQDFAFVSTNPMHKVSVENSTTDVAKPGDVLVNKTEGLFTGQEYQIQWFKDGVAIGDPVTVTADADGTVTSVPTTVSPDLESTAIYTSGVFSQGVSTASTSNALALDYILAEPFTKAELNEPAYQAETGLPGSTVDVKSPTFTDQNGADVAVPEGTTFKLGENGPEGVTINSDGSLVVAVPQDAVPGSVITVPVTVSYNDGSTDTVNAEVTVQAPQSDLNNPTYQGGEGTPGTTVDLASPTFTDQTGTPVTPPDGTTYAAGTNAPAGVTVNPDGSLSVAIADTEEPGTTISVPVDVTYPDGSVDTVNVPVTVVPQAPVVLPTEAGIDPIAGTPYPVTGTGYPGGTVDVTLPDGTVQQTTVNPDGTWTINPTAPLEAGQVVSATQTVGVDYNGQPNVSTAGTGTVVDTTAPDAPVVSPVTDADTAVSGTGEPNGTVTVTFPDGATAETPVDAEGNWTVNVPEGTDLKAGDEIKATEKDKAGNVSVPGTTVVTDETAPDAPVVSPVTDADTAVSGTGEPNGTVTVTFPDGTTVEAPVDAGGNWTVDVPAGTDLKAGDEIKATEKDEAGNVSEPGTTVVTDATAPEAPVVSPVTDADTAVSGTGEPNGTVTVTFPDGTTAEASVDADGNWTVDVPAGTDLKAGDEIKATEKDEAGNVSEPGTTVVTDATAPEAPVVSPVTDADTVVSGTGEPNGTVTVTFPDGTTAEAPVDADGNWTVDVPAGTGLKAGDEITATVKDEAGNVSVPGTAVVTDTTAPVVGPIDDVTTPEDQAITPIPVVVTDDSTTNVEVTGLPEGVVYNPETGQIEGTPTTPGTYPVTVTVEDEAGNVTEETFTITVTDETAPEAPVVSPVKDTDTVVSGTGEPNGTVTVTFPDGTTAEAPVDADGNWTVNVPAGTDLKAGDKVTATVTDAAGNTSEPTETTVTTTADTVAPDAPVINPVQDGDKVVTGTGEPGAEVTVTFPGGKETTATVDENGNWTVEVPADTTVKAGDVIKAVQTDEAGNVSDESTVTVGGDNGEVPGTTPGTDNTGDNGSVDNTDAPDQTDDTKVPSEPGTSEPTEGTDNSAEVPSTDAPTADNGTNAQTSNGVEAPAATETKAPEAATADSKAQPSKAQESKELPDTGNSTGNATIFGGLFAALGSVFLFNRRKKDSKENK